MNNKLNIIYSVLIDYFGLVVSILINIIGVRIYLKYLSLYEYGVWLSIFALMSIITSFDFSSDQYLLTKLPSDNIFYTKSNDIISKNIIYKLIASLLIIIISFVIAINLNKFISLNSLNYKLLKQVFIISVFASIMSSLAGTFSTILISRSHFKIVNLLLLLVVITNFVFNIFFLFNNFNILSFAYSLLIVNTILFIFFLIYTIRKYPHLKAAIIPTFIIDKNIIKYTTFNQLIKIVASLRSQYIVIIIGKIVGPLAISTYNISTRLPSLIPILFSKIVSPLFPSFSRLVIDKNYKLLKDYFLKVTFFLLRMSILSTIILYFSTINFVKLWLPNSIFFNNFSFALFLVTVFIASLFSAFGSIIISRGDLKHMAFFSTLEIFITIFLSTYLGYKFGIEGIILGFLFSSLIGYTYQYITVSKFLSIRFKDIMNYHVIINALIPNIFTFFFSLLFLKFYKIDNWINIILYVLFCIFFNIFPFDVIKLTIQKSRINFNNLLKLYIGNF